jgi:hypothetical protein
MTIMNRRAVIANAIVGLGCAYLPRNSDAEDEEDEEPRSASSHSAGDEVHPNSGGDEKLTGGGWERNESLSDNNNEAPVSTAPEIDNLSLNPIERIATGTSGNSQICKDAGSQGAGPPELGDPTTRESDAVSSAVEDLHLSTSVSTTIPKDLIAVLEDAMKVVGDSAYFCISSPAIITKNGDSVYGSVGFCAALNGNTYSSTGIEVSEEIVGFQFGVASSADKYLSGESVYASVGLGIGESNDFGAIALFIGSTGVGYSNGTPTGNVFDSARHGFNEFVRAGGAALEQAERQLYRRSLDPILNP